MTSRAVHRSKTAIAASLGVAASTVMFAAVLLSSSSSARAQAVQDEQPLHLTVGSGELAPPPLLPTVHLRSAWTSKPTPQLQSDPVLLPNGQILVTSNAGEATVLDDDGKALTKFATGPRAASAATRLSDGTVLFAAASGEIVGVRAGQTRFRTRIAFDTREPVAPLALADGGAVVAVGTDLVCVDASGAIRARATLDEAASQLVALGESIAVVSRSGDVHLWIPGGDIVAGGSFGLLPDGVIAGADARAHTLTAVVEGRLVDLDVMQKLERTRVQPARGDLVGPPVRIGSDVAAMLRDGSHVDLVQFGSDGSEQRRVQLAIVNALVGDAGSGAPSGGGPANGRGLPVRGGVAVRGGTVSANGSSGSVSVGAVPPVGFESTFGFTAVADGAGNVAFAIPMGPVGVVARDGTVVTAANPCSSSRAIGTSLLPAWRGFPAGSPSEMAASASASSDGGSDGGLGETGPPRARRTVDEATLSGALLVSCAFGTLQELVSSQK